MATQDFHPATRSETCSPRRVHWSLKRPRQSRSKPEDDATGRSMATRRIKLLLGSLGIDETSFDRVIEWALTEHQVTVIHMAIEEQSDLFRRDDAMRLFRDLVEQRTGRRWSPHDVGALFDRVKLEGQKHYRQPIEYGEFLKLLWQAPLRCVQCGREPPEVVLHVDHIVPASRGGGSRRPNLQFLCAEDNLRKSANREVSDPWLDLQ